MEFQSILVDIIVLLSVVGLYRHFRGNGDSSPCGGCGCGIQEDKQ